MGSPLGPTFANIFLCYHEKIWLENCPVEFKRYVDDSSLLLQSKDHTEKFRSYLNCQHPNIKFTSQMEENNKCISFLDTKISISYRMVPSTIWRIFSEFLIF